MHEARKPPTRTPDAVLAEQARHTAELNAHYEHLAFGLDDGDKGNFLSGWQCDNPFSAPLFAAVKERAKTLDYGKYTYFDDELDLSRKVTKLHKDFDGIAPEYVFCGSGSTSLLYGIAAYLRRTNVTKIHFIPPIYFTFQIALDSFGILTVPAARKQAFEQGFILDLPLERHSVLFLIDPVWYAGCPLSFDIVEELRVWQRKTSSLILVDGSLQYMSWNHSVEEATARLDPSLTFRLICPAKQLASHGYRFSYVLLPISQKQRFAWTYTNINGSANADAVAFGHEAIAAISQRSIPDKLTYLVAERHRRLRAEGVIDSTIEPRCGYFVFETIKCGLPSGYIRVDGNYFNQQNYPGYTKINLLSPSIHVLGL